MSAHPHPRLTEEEYLAIERAAECKSDYYDGRMYAMSGASFRHVTITGNLAFGLRLSLEGRGCFVGTNDMRLRTAGALYTYPDVVILCGQPELRPGPPDTLLNPTAIIEVLSPSTESYDRGLKFSEYQKVESLQEYALVWQTEPRAETYRRQADGQWLFTGFAGLDDSLRLSSIDCAVSLAQVYENVIFDDQPRPPAPAMR